MQKRTLMLSLGLIVAAVGVWALVSMRRETPRGNEAGVERHGSGGVDWYEDLQEARRVAEREGKPLLIALRINKLGIKGVPDL